MPDALRPALVYLAFLAISMAAGWLLAGPLAWVRTNSILERLLLYWLLGVIVLSWVGVLLAAMGYFRWWLLLALVLLAGAWTLWRARYKAWQTLEAIPAPSHTPWPALLLILVLLGGAGWLFARPAESYLLTDDSAVYTIGGIVLARQGTLSFEPAAIYPFDDLAVEGGFWDPSAVQEGDIWLSRKDFLRQFAEVDSAGIFSPHYGPFYQWTLAHQTLEIGFLPLPKVWIAFAAWLFGPGRATWAIPFLGLTGIAALYGLVSRTLGWPSALGAGLLLSVSLPQVWFSRLPISEIPTQALLLIGLYLAVLSRQEAARPHVARPLAVWSALSLGALAVLRFEALPLLAVLALLVWLLWRRARVPREVIGPWLGVLAVSAVCGLVLSATVAPYYLFTRAIALLGPTTVRLIMPLLAATVLAFAAFYHLKQRDPARLRFLVDGVMRYVPLVCAGAWILWSAIALVRLIGSDWGSSLAGWLVQYWTRPALVSSVMGAVAFFWREYKAGERPELAAFLGLAVLLLLGFSVSAMVTPLHPWAMRRLVPVVMPALAVGAASLLVRRPGYISLNGFSRLARRTGARLVRLVGVALLVVLALAIGQRTRPVLFYQERRGLWKGLTALAQRLPEGAVLFFDDTDIGRRLTQPMELVFGHPSLILQDTKALQSETAMTDRFIEQALAQGRPIYLVITQGWQAGLLSGWELASRGAASLDTDLLAMPWGRLPQASDIVRQSLPLDIYQVLPRGQTIGRDGLESTLDIPVGPGSYPYLRSGFYPWEMDQGGAVWRWTQAEAIIATPWPAADATIPVTLCLTIDLSNWRTDGQPSHLQVEVEGLQLFTGDLAVPLKRQTLRIPIRNLDNKNLPQLEIQLQSDTWQPGGGDPRELGVMLYGLQLAPPALCETAN